MGTSAKFYGLVIAGIGFFLTRFTVTLALEQDPLRFYLSGVVPLSLGLGLAAFGIALAVADVEASLVRTTAAWCVAGGTAMLVLVLLTVVGSSAGEMPTVEVLRSQTYLSNFLIGGCVGGTLTGLYASRSRQQRGELRRQTRRLEVLNRMLRHEVLNAVSVIQGYASPDAPADRDTAGIIRERATAIERTIEEVKYLTRNADAATTSQTVSLRDCLDASVASVTDQHPDARVSLDAPEGPLRVRATTRLEQVFDHLLENAVVHAGDDAPAVAVSVTETADSVRVSVRDEGPGLPERQRALLETGEIETYDDPTTGFGLNVVRLLVESYGGAIETTVEDGETTVTVILARANPTTLGVESNPSGFAGVRPDVPTLLVTLGAAIVAGVAFGAVSIARGGSIAGIGGFYGAASPVVGWITHEFHSIVFGFVFAGLLAEAPARYRNATAGHVLIGLGWAWCSGSPPRGWSPRRGSSCSASTRRFRRSRSTACSPTSRGASRSAC